MVAFATLGNTYDALQCTKTNSIDMKSAAVLKGIQRAGGTRTEVRIAERLANPGAP